MLTFRVNVSASCLYNSIPRRHDGSLFTMYSFSGLISNYTFVDASTTWEKARDACRDMNAHLVTMKTIAEWNTVRNLIAERVKGDTSNHHWYIGLRNVSGTWTWTEEPDGVVQGTVAEDDMRWELDEPSIQFSEPCAEIQSNYRGQQGHFNNVLCSERPSSVFHRGYICEREHYVM